MPLGCCGLWGKTNTAINTMFKKALIAAASVALSTPAFAGSIGTLQSTNTIITTGGSRAVTINGTYAAEEHTVSTAADGSGSSASATWSPGAGPSLTSTGTGYIAGPNVSSASYSTNSVTSGTYVNDIQSAFGGTETVTMDGVFFNH